MKVFRQYHLMFNNTSQPPAKTEKFGANAQSNAVELVTTINTYLYNEEYATKAGIVFQVEIYRLKKIRWFIRLHSYSTFVSIFDYQDVYQQTR